MNLVTLLALAGSPQTRGYDVYFEQNNGIYVLQPNGTILPVLQHARSSAISPDGKSLACWRNRDLILFNIAGKRVSAIAKNALGNADLYDRIPPPSWLPASQTVVAARSEKVRLTYQATSNDKDRTRNKSTINVWSIYRYKPMRNVKKGWDSDYFLSTDDSGVSAFSLTSSSTPSASPDGKAIAFCQNGDLWIAEPTSDDNGFFSNPASASEQRIAAGNTQEKLGAGSQTSFIYRISWSPSSKLIAYYEDRYTSGGNYTITVGKVVRNNDGYISLNKIATIHGANPVFVDEKTILYDSSSRGPDLRSFNLNSKTDQLLLKNGKFPVIVR